MAVSFFAICGDKANMSRYLKTLRLFWSTAIAAELEYRINFAIAALSSIGNLAGSFLDYFCSIAMVIPLRVGDGRRQ